MGWGGGPRGVGELPAGDIRASQGTFSSLVSTIKFRKGFRSLSYR